MTNMLTQFAELARSAQLKTVQCLVADDVDNTGVLAHHPHGFVGTVDLDHAVLVLVEPKSSEHLFFGFLGIVGPLDNIVDQRGCIASRSNSGDFCCCEGAFLVLSS